MGANAFLPASSVTPTFIGNYVELEFPTPLKTTSLTALTAAEEFLATGENSLSQDYTPGTTPPGDIGMKLQYYPNLNGPFKDTQKQYVYFVRIQDGWRKYKTWYDNFNTAKGGTYATDLANYNTKLRAEKQRQSSSLFAMLTKAPAGSEVPTRPCPPEQPPQYAGF